MARFISNNFSNLSSSKSEKVILQKPFYEYAFNNLIKKGIKLSYTVIPESEWNEVDNENDYNDLLVKFKLWSE